MLLVAALLAACSPESASDRQATIRIAVPLVPPAIGNPYQGVTIPTTLALQAIFDTVTMVDGAGNAIPGLAIAWESQDPLHWIFRLRPGVTFSNGEPLTAEALVESVRHMTSKRGRAETIGSTLPASGACPRRRTGARCSCRRRRAMRSAQDRSCWPGARKAGWC
jgi:peptide/nickel transport system substrate-binding protein